MSVIKNSFLFSGLAIIATSALIASRAFASGAVAGKEGGGGDAFVCHTGRSVELLDYVEGETLTGLPLAMLPDNVGYMTQVHYVLRRLAKIDPVAAKWISNGANHFMSEAQFLPRAMIKTIATDHHEAINPPAGCSLEQFVYQIRNPMPLEKRYLVNEDVWAHAPNHTRAGIILHEVIYRYAMSIGKQSSDGSRYYNFVISSAAMQNMTPAEYVRALQATGLEVPSPRVCKFSVKAKGLAWCIGQKFRVRLDNSKTLIYSEYTVPDPNVYNNGRTYISPSEIALPTFALRSGQTIEHVKSAVYDDDPKQAYDSGYRGTRGSVTYPPGLELYLSQRYKAKIAGLNVWLGNPSGDPVMVYPNGQIESVTLDGAQTIHAFGASFAVPDEGKIEYYPDGTIRYLDLQKPAVVATRNGYRSFIGNISLYKNSSIKRGFLAADGTFLVGNQRLKFTTNFPQHNSFWINHSPVRRMSFYPNGSVRIGYLAPGQTVTINGKKISPQTIACFSAGGGKTAKVNLQTWFYKSGTVAAATFKGDGQKFEAVDGSVVKLPKDGRFYYVTFNRSQKLQKFSGRYYWDQGAIGFPTSDGAYTLDTFNCQK